MERRAPNTANPQDAPNATQPRVLLVYKQSIDVLYKIFSHAGVQ